MAEHMKAGLNKSPKYYGSLVRSPLCPARIRSIQLPEAGDKFYTLMPSEIPQGFQLSVLSGHLPLLNDETVLYPDQPLMALFGPDWESAVLLGKEIVIDAAEIEEKDLEFEDGEEESLSFGKDSEEVPREGLREIRSTASTTSIYIENPDILICECWIEGDKYHVETPTQWPALIRKNLALLLDVDETNVIIHQSQCRNLKDEYVVTPVILACIGILAVKKIGMPVVMMDHARSAGPAVKVTRKTLCQEDGHPVEEECEMEAYLGAYQLADREFIRHALAGLIPNYPVSTFSAKVKTKRCVGLPTLFFDSCGYSEALFSSEEHANRIASAFELPLAKWKDYIFTRRRPFTDYMPSVELSLLSHLCEDIVRDSDFNRKWASYEIQKDPFSILPFTRGIGLASGFSVSGLSTSGAREIGAQAKITLTEKQNITLLTSFPPTQAFTQAVKNVVDRELDPGSNTGVIILDNDGTMTDSGPDVLSRSSCNFLDQLATACAKLNLEKSEEKLPMSNVFSCDETLMPCEFEASGAACVIVETRVDNISFKPVVLEVWASVSIGELSMTAESERLVRQQIISTLRGCGASFASPFSVNIVMEEGGSSAGSACLAVRGLTKAAFITALKQCLGRLEAKLPLSADDLARAYAGREDAK